MKTNNDDVESVIVNEDEGWNGEAATDILLRGCVIALPTFHAKSQITRQ